ncbi:hypothetical protein BELL_0335g00130 [Botrytis elliptica]|uniref:ZZ-type domain-containing protein n=1 Tax=Botrytis elliptica TaxID=278938 RepID=A0A4Z1JJJ4_9HELO|nr:hypothetical protein EAE99_007944 [Botrytis elliptica]TGO73748.1 hypothetical protein BELL_0335g00130 [Botrytis elliptica]
MSETTVAVQCPSENVADTSVAASPKIFGLTISEASTTTPAEYDIVAVHGLGGDSRYTWGKPSGEGTWFKDALFPNTNVRIMTYDYDLEGIAETIYTRKGILNEASKLLKSLVDLRKSVVSENAVTKGGSDGAPELEATRRPLIFVGHNLGIIIIKQALVLAGFDLSNDESIRTSTVAMISFSAPHRHRSFEDMERSIAKLLLKNGGLHLQNFMAAVNGLSRAIVDINSLFIYSKVTIHVRLINVFSSSTDHVLQVFDEFMSTMDVPFERRIGIDRPEKELPCSSKDHSQISEGVLDFISYSPDFDSPLSRCLKIMLSQASPVYSPSVADDLSISEDLTWIAGNTNFQEWLSAKNTNILHMHGNFDVSRFTKFLTQQIESWKDAPTDTSVLYFEFRKHDSRYNTLKSMFYTFLAQLISHYRECTDGLDKNLERFLNFHSWTNQHLLNFIYFLRMDDSIDNVRYIINGIDECEEDCGWFLASLALISKTSETPFKVIVTSKNHQPILSKCLTINMDQHKSNSTPQLKAPSAVAHALLRLFQERPQYCGLEASLREILSQANEDYVCHLVLDWLRFRPHSATKSCLKEILRNLSVVTPEHILTVIMHSVPAWRQPWAQKILQWVTYSHHPLTIWELRGVNVNLDAEVLDQEECTVEELMEKLHETFGGILVVENNEVSYRHPFIRHFFTTLAPINAWFYSGSRVRAHKDIAIFCLGYLSLIESQRRAATFYRVDLHGGPHVCPVSDFRHDLISYATIQWPTHCKVAISEELESSDLLVAVETFLGQTEIRDIWAETYHILSHPIIRPKTPLSTAFVILSSLGLNTLISPIIHESEYSQDLHNEYDAALVEAARHGHEDTLETLLKSFSPTKPTLELSIRSADYRVLFTLLKCTSSLSDKYDYSTEILCRAAWLGLDDAVEFLIGKSVAVDFEPLPRMSPLCLAVRMTHGRVVKLLISANADLNWSSNGATPLEIACSIGSLESITLLLEAKADIDCRDDNGWSVLQTATYSGHHEIVQKLLSAGADKSYPGDETQPLIKALKKGYFKCCRAIVEAGAPTIASEGSRPPLWFGVDDLNKKMCELLLKHGADPNWKAGLDHAPILTRAVQRGGDVDLVKLLLDNGADVNVADESSSLKESVISTAAGLGLTDVVKLLAERNADVNVSGAEGVTPIYFAARSNKPETVQLLLDLGANLEMDEKLNDGWGPLLIAFDFVEVVRILLQNGADITRTSSGGNILFLASRHNEIEVVRVCLQYKPDLNIGYHHTAARSYEGDTALTAAISGGHTEIVRLLLEAGANLNQRAYLNKYPLQYAFTNEASSDGPLRALLEYHPDLDLVDDGGNTALHYLRETTPLAWVKLLVNAGASIEIRNKNYITPLGIAILRRNTEIVEYLLYKNAQVNITGGSFGTPLIIACLTRDLPLIKRVVEKGSGVNVDLASPNFYGTALQTACRSPKSPISNEFPLVSYLIDDAKANINAYGGRIGYAINTACLYNDSSLVKFLLDRGADSDVADWMGRKPIHLAALRTVDHFNLLSDDKFIKAEDQLKRIPLHYAVLSGKIDLVAMVLKRSIACLGPDVVNYPDCDNWTPLMWAARICGRWDTTTDGQPEIIELLLSNGGNRWVKGEGLDREWSPLKVARYYGASEEVVKLLTPDALSPDGEKWVRKHHTSRKASVQPSRICDGCLLGIVGTWFKCQSCWDFDLCFKCYRSRDTIQPDCSFEERGTEYDPEPEAEPEIREKPLEYEDNANVAEIESSDEESEDEISSNGVTGSKDDSNVVDLNEDDDDEEEDDDSGESN